MQLPLNLHVLIMCMSTASQLPAKSIRIKQDPSYCPPSAATSMSLSCMIMIATTSLQLLSHQEPKTTSSAYIIRSSPCSNDVASPRDYNDSTMKYLISCDRKWKTTTSVISLPPRETMAGMQQSVLYKHSKTTLSQAFVLCTHSFHFSIGTNYYRRRS